MADEENKEQKIDGAQVAADVWDPILTLSDPVTAHGEEVKELKFREPMGKDIEEVGMPVMPNFRFDTVVMSDMMARLAGVTPSTIRQLKARDWTTGAYKLWNFFLPGPR